MSSIYVIEITPTHTKGALQSRKKKPPPKKLWERWGGKVTKAKNFLTLAPPFPIEIINWLFVEYFVSPLDCVETIDLLPHNCRARSARCQQLADIFNKANNSKRQQIFSLYFRK